MNKGENRGRKEKARNKDNGRNKRSKEEEGSRNKERRNAIGCGYDRVT
jgi:hypothetical protein